MAAQQHESFEIEVEGLAEAKEWGGESFAPEVPPGEYLLAISSVARGTSKNGNSTVIVEFEVADGEYAGKRLKNWYTLTEKAMGRMQKLKRAVGATMDSKVRSDELLGAQLYATVTHEPGEQQKNADGTLKCDANGNPYPPSTFAKVLNERAVEAAAQETKAAVAAPPPVTRKNNTAAATQTRRA
jgi:hypothetical protein